MLVFELVVSVPMTAEEKIKEAEYFLNRLPDLQMDVVRFEVSAFLSASRSVFYHLLDDYAKKFNLGEIKKLHVQSFEARAKKLRNKRALDFIEWYRGVEKSIDENPECGFLSQLRDLSVHRETPKVGYRLQGRTLADLPAGASVEFPIVPPPLRHPVKVQGIIRKGSEVIGKIEAEESAIPFFDGFPTFDLLKVCTTLLAQLKEAVVQAHKRFD